jgi:hypothetical protein
MATIMETINTYFQKETIPYPIDIFGTEQLHFGIVDMLMAGNIPITSKHTHLVFTIDSSASMCDIGRDKQTKMSHIHHTLENMLRIFHDTPGCPISVYIQSFDTQVKQIMNISDIRTADLDILTNDVRTITPEGSTNIELALQTASINIACYKASHPDHHIVHLFLTDGEITMGSINRTVLKDLVPKVCTNIFIGYGQTHDSELLCHLSSDLTNEYRFIDALENAALVYSEIIHGLLYKAIEDITVTIGHGEIYDYKTNSWENTIFVPHLVSEQLKTYHIRTNSKNECTITLVGKDAQTGDTVHVFLDTHTLIDLDTYILRQKTQELLHKARHHPYKYTLPDGPLFVFDNEKEDAKEDEEEDKEAKEGDEHTQTTRALKIELRDFHKTLMDYIKDKSLESDPLVNMLCDDIYIAYKTIGTPVGNMYSCARQTSNGQQQTYMCSASQDMVDFSATAYSASASYSPCGPPYKLQRQTAGGGYLNAPGDTKETTTMTTPSFIDQYVPSQHILSPFSNEGAVSLMREVSGIKTLGVTKSSS